MQTLSLVRQIVLGIILVVIAGIGAGIAMDHSQWKQRFTSERSEVRSAVPEGNGLTSAAAPSDELPDTGFVPATQSPPANHLLGGQLLQRSLWSVALGRGMPYSIYLPPDYQSSDTRYPVLYLLHGYYGNYMEWADIGIHRVADEMIRVQTIEPLIVVMVEGETSYFVNHGDSGPRWGDYVERDVVTTIDESYRTIPTRAARAVGGLSMGGHAALRIAFQHPEIFGGVGAHSPTLRWERPEDKFEFADDTYYDSINPLQIAREAPSLDQLRIWIDVGDEDWNWFWVSDLHDELTTRTIPHEFSFFRGQHEGTYWSAHLVTYLDFYARAFHSPVAPDVAR
ncbi:MAG: alpha/beta hydrolase [Chloroflexota bacterium]